MKNKTQPEEVWDLLREMIQKREHLAADFDRRFEQMMDSQERLRKSQEETDRQLKETGQRLRESSEKVDRQLEETNQRLKESSAKVDRQLEETNQRLKESSAKVDRQLEETSQQLKKTEDLFTGQWGKLMESLVEGDLINLLRSRGIDVNRVLPRSHGVCEGRQWEIDLIAVNGEEIVVVEVKTTLKVDNIRDFIGKTLSKIKTYFPEYKDHKIYGAVAYLRAEENVTVFAEKQGLFIIRATGDSASITNHDSFAPKVF